MSSPMRLDYPSQDLLARRVVRLRGCRDDPMDVDVPLQPRAPTRRKIEALEDNIVNLVDEEHYPREIKICKHSDEEVEKIRVRVQKMTLQQPNKKRLHRQGAVLKVEDILYPQQRRRHDCSQMRQRVVNRMKKIPRVASTEGSCQYRFTFSLASPTTPSQSECSAPIQQVLPEQQQQQQQQQQVVQPFIPLDEVKAALDKHLPCFIVKGFRKSHPRQPTEKRTLRGTARPSSRRRAPVAGVPYASSWRPQKFAAGARDGPLMIPDNLLDGLAAKLTAPTVELVEEDRMEVYPPPAEQIIVCHPGPSVMEDQVMSASQVSVAVEVAGSLPPSLVSCTSPVAVVQTCTLIDGDCGSFSCSVCGILREVQPTRRVVDPAMWVMRDTATEHDDDDDVTVVDDDDKESSAKASLPVIPSPAVTISFASTAVHTPSPIKTSMFPGEVPPSPMKVPRAPSCESPLPSYEEVAGLDNNDSDDLFGPSPVLPPAKPCKHVHFAADDELERVRFFSSAYDYVDAVTHHYGTIPGAFSEDEFEYELDG